MSSFFSDHKSTFERLAHGVLNFGAKAAKELGIEAAIETYHIAVQNFERKYLDDDETSSALIRRFRARFYRVLKITVHVLDKIDGYVGGKQVGRWAKVGRVMTDDPSPKGLELRKKKKVDEE